VDYGTVVQENPGVHLGWNQHLFHRGILVHRNYGGFHWGLSRMWKRSGDLPASGWFIRL